MQRGLWRDDTVEPPPTSIRCRELGEATAFEICAEAGESAREGRLTLQDRAAFERQIRCALAIDPLLTKTYLGYLDLAILAGEILLHHALRTMEQERAPQRDGTSHPMSR